MGTTYLALLRGINVGGHTVKMERLRELFGGLGFTDVWTYIQSGNVFFTSTQQDRQALTRSIEQQLARELGFAVPVMLRTVGGLERIVRADPFGQVQTAPDIRLCVAFTSNPVPSSLVPPILSPKNDMEIVAVSPHELFMTWTIIGGRPPAFSAFLAKLTSDTVTTRFFPTLTKMLETAEHHASQNERLPKVSAAAGSSGAEPS